MIYCQCHLTTGGDHALDCPMYQPVKTVFLGPAPAPPMGWCCPGCGAFNSPTLLRCPCKPVAEGDPQKKLLFG